MTCVFGIIKINLESFASTVSPSFAKFHLQGTQGTQGLPLTIFSIPNSFIYAGIQEHQKSKVRSWYAPLQNPRSTLGKHTFKTQGPPLVSLLLMNHDDYSQRSRFHKTFNEAKVIPFPLNHQGKDSIGQDDLLPDWLIRPSIRCKSH